MEGRSGKLMRGRVGERGQRIVLRVPVLYGPVRVNSDSAINILLDVVEDQSGKTYKMGTSLFPHSPNFNSLGAWWRFKWD